MIDPLSRARPLPAAKFHSIPTALREARVPVPVPVLVHLRGAAEEKALARRVALEPAVAASQLVHRTEPRHDPSVRELSALRAT